MTNHEAMYEAARLIGISEESMEDFSEKAKQEMKAILELSDFTDKDEAYQALADVKRIWQSEQERIIFQRLSAFLKENTDNGIEESRLLEQSGDVRNQVLGTFLFEFGADGTDNKALAEKLLAMCV